MISIWKIIRNLLAIIGALAIYGAVSTSDYYIIELGTVEPAYVKTQLIVGVILVLPMLLHVFYELYKEGKNDVQNR